MRVLWTHNFDPKKKNAGCFMYEAAAGLKKLGVDLTLEYLGNLRSLRGVVSAAKAVRKRSSDYDLVHSQYGSACALATSFARNRPLVVTLRGNDWNLHSDSLSFSFFHTRLAKLLTMSCLSRYSGVVTVSRRMEGEIRQIWKGCKTRVLPSPLDLARWSPESPGPREAGEGYDVLFVAQRLDDPVKRYPLALQAIEKAKAQLPGIRFQTAVSVPFEDMPRVMARVDAILCTSDTEGWPNCIKEALACNVPFVSTDVGDLREIAAVEESCRVVEADPDALAAALCAVLQGGRPSGLRRFVERMDVGVLSQELLDFYEEILKAAAEKGENQGGRRG